MAGASWRKDEKKTRDPNVELLLRTFWGQALPMVSAQTVIPTGDPRQRWGTDRELLLNDGSTVPVEDKVRFRDYGGDVLLELEHVFDDGRPPEPGWIRKPLQCHYIGMLWVPCRTFRVYPWLGLQAWYMHRQRDGRLKEYARVSSRANNNGYRTVSVVVPERDLPCLVKTRSRDGE